MPKKPKKQTRRSKQQYPDLDPKFNLKTRVDLLDQDYLHKLSPKELEFLNKFNKEYVGASLDSKNPKKNLHKSKKMHKDCYDRNNARNRDILTRAKASNQIVDYEELYENSAHEDIETILVEQLDNKSIQEAVSWLANENDKDEEEIQRVLINDSKAEE